MKPNRFVTTERDEFTFGDPEAGSGEDAPVTPDDSDESAEEDE